MKERKGKGDALRLAVRAPPRRAVWDQTVFRALRELKAFVLSRITVCLCQEEGTGQCLPFLARSCGVPAQSWGQSWGRAVVAWLPVQGGSHWCLC